MAFFIIIRGPLGCGKSTIARVMAGILKAENIAVDNVLAENGLDGINQKMGCIPAENFIKANQIMVPRARKNLDKGRIVIFDACFYHKETIENLIKSLPCKGFAFTLKAPLKVCIERDSKRRKHYGKAAVAEVYELVSRFDYGIVVDASKPVRGIVDEILFHLPKK